MLLGAVPSASVILLHVHSVTVKFYSCFQTEVKGYLLFQVFPDSLLWVLEPFVQSSTAQLISLHTNLSVDMATSSVQIGAVCETGPLCYLSLYPQGIAQFLAQRNNPNPLTK